MIIKRTQQKRFPVFCLICCLTCLFCFIGSISAFAFQTATPSDADKIRITKIQNEDELLALPDFTLPLKSSPSDDDMEPIYLFALKYQTVSATVIENNESRSERFSVCWDFSAIDQTTLGDYAATGRIELPEGYCFGENVLKELVISVHVEKTPPAVIISIEQWYPYTDAFALPQGSTEETLNHLLRFSPHHLECYTENKISYSALVEWDLSDIDFDTVGLYQAKGQLAAPENTEFADGIVFPEISIPVSIQAPGRPDINCVIAARGNLRFPWITPPGDPDKINVWLSENDEPWKQLENGVYAGKEMLSIKTYLLTATVFRSITMADRPASCPSLTQMSLSLRGIIRVIAMEGTQKEIRLAASHSLRPNRTLIRGLNRTGTRTRMRIPIEKTLQPTGQRTPPL